MIKLELTVDQFNAIINLLATIPAGQSFYSIAALKVQGDAQLELLKEQAAAPQEPEVQTELGLSV
jgi:hypothetical protein